MKALAINGSPRKKWNTHTLLERALEGAAEQGAETSLFHLYEMDYEGCRACLACKRKDSKSLGSCVLRDDLSPVLKQIDSADLLIIGSPIYFSEVTGKVRMLIERLLFQGLSYDVQGTTLLPKKNIPTLFIYTMNMPEIALKESGQIDRFRYYEQTFNRFLGPAKTLYATQTLQTQDYEKYHMAMFDVESVRHRRVTEFPLAEQKAHDYSAAIISGEIEALPDELAIVN